MTVLAIEKTYEAFSRRPTPSRLSASMNSKENDEALMLRYQSGDSWAFEILFDRYKDPIHRYLARQCKLDAVDEIFQDVWLKLIQARHQYRSASGNRFSTYLYRIAHNRLMDFYRHTVVKDNVIVDAEYDESYHLTTNCYQLPDQQVDTERKVEKLLGLIEQLPANQQEAFLLKEEAGFGVQEIADITGVSRETAKSRLRYAFSRLRDGMRGVE